MATAVSELDDKTWVRGKIRYTRRGVKGIIYGPTSSTDGTRKSTKTADKDEAQRMVETWWGIQIKNETRTFGDAVDACLPDMEDLPSYITTRKSALMWMDYNTDIMTKPFAEITRDYVLTVIKAKIASNPDISKATLNNNYTATISSIMHHAFHDKGFGFPHNTLPVFHRYKRNQLDEKESVILTHDQEQALFDVLPDDHKLALKVALYTGLRKGELYNLTWDKLELVQETVTIKDKNKNTAKNATLVITLIPDAVNLLWEERYKNNWEGFVLPTQRPMDHYKWKEYLEQAGLPTETRWHDLRHTFATRLVHKGINPFILQKLMGHTEVTMTQRYYKAENSSIRQSLAGISIA